MDSVNVGEHIDRGKDQKTNSPSLKRYGQGEDFPANIEEEVKEIQKSMMDFLRKGDRRPKTLPFMPTEFIYSQVTREKLKAKMLSVAGEEEDQLDNFLCYDIFVPFNVTQKMLFDKKSKTYLWSKNIVSFNRVSKEKRFKRIMTVDIEGHPKPTAMKDNEQRVVPIDKINDLPSKPLRKFHGSKLVGRCWNRLLISSHHMTISWLRSRLQRAIDKHRKEKEKVDIIPVIKQKKNGPLFLSFIPVQKSDDEVKQDVLIAFYPAFRLSPCYLIIPVIPAFDSDNIPLELQYAEAEKFLWKRISKCFPGDEPNHKHKSPIGVVGERILENISVKKETASKLVGTSQTSNQQKNLPRNIVRKLNESQCRQCQECCNPASRMLLEYYFKYSEIPEQEMNKASNLVNEILEFIRHSIKVDRRSNDPKILEFIWSGSVPEKLKVVQPDEFDVMVHVGLPESKISHKFYFDEVFPPGYSICTVDPVGTISNSLKRCLLNVEAFDAQHCLNPEKLAFGWFYGMMELAINKYQKPSNNPKASLKIKRGGPALMLQITVDSSTLRKSEFLLPEEIKVDLVLALSAGPNNSHLYVPKRARPHYFYQTKFKRSRVELSKTAIESVQLGSKLEKPVWYLEEPTIESTSCRMESEQPRMETKEYGAGLDHLQGDMKEQKIASKRWENESEWLKLRMQQSSTQLEQSENEIDELKNKLKGHKTKSKQSKLETEQSGTGLEESNTCLEQSGGEMKEFKMESERNQMESKQPKVEAIQSGLEQSKMERKPLEYGELDLNQPKTESKKRKQMSEKLQDELDMASEFQIDQERESKKSKVETVVGYEELNRPDLKHQKTESEHSKVLSYHQNDKSHILGDLSEQPKKEPEKEMSLQRQKMASERQTLDRELKGELTSKTDNAQENYQHMWRVSYSSQEKKILEYVEDKQQSEGVEGCQRICLKILKTICTREALKHRDSVICHKLSSYILKTALFHLLASRSDWIKEWTVECLADRYVDLLNKISQLGDDLTHFFINNESSLKRVFPICKQLLPGNRSFNLLDDLPATLKMQLLKRFSQIANSFKNCKYEMDKADASEPMEESVYLAFREGILGGKTPEDVIHPFEGSTDEDEDVKITKTKLKEKQLVDELTNEAVKNVRRSGNKVDVDQNMQRARESNENKSRKRKPKNSGYKDRESEGSDSEFELFGRIYGNTDDDQSSEDETRVFKGDYSCNIRVVEGDRSDESSDGDNNFDGDNDDIDDDDNVGDDDFCDESDKSDERSDGDNHFDDDNDDIDDDDNVGDDDFCDESDRSDESNDGDNNFDDNNDDIDDDDNVGDNDFCDESDRSDESSDGDNNFGDGDFF